MIQRGDREPAAGIRHDPLPIVPACRLLADLGPQLRRTVTRLHLRVPLVSDEELRQELVADLLQAAAGGRGKTAPALLKDAKSRLCAWAIAEQHFRSLPRCIDAGDPAPSAEEACLIGLAAVEAAAQTRRSLDATVAFQRREPNA